MPDKSSGIRSENPWQEESPGRALARAFNGLFHLRTLDLLRDYDVTDTSSNRVHRECDFLYPADV